MKKLFTAATLIALSCIYACTKESGSFSKAALPVPLISQKGTHAWSGRSAARLSGDDYSKSIPVDTANRMIQSYLTGVGYPSVDTAIRSLYFDADTLRAYLQNSDITTIKFVLAHPTAYVNSDPTSAASSLNADALTLIIVGLNDDEEYVLNNANGVYDNMFRCPFSCHVNSSALIQ